MQRQTVRFVPYALAALMLLCTAPTPAHGVRGQPSHAAQAAVFHGKITYYGVKHAGRKTASGEVFNPHALTMAHKTLPFGTLVRITNPRNKHSVVVRVNDRGPFTKRHVGDLSLAAAKHLKMTRMGVLFAKLEVLAPSESSRYAQLTR
jgi:rare lipoprotein A